MRIRTYAKRAILAAAVILVSGPAVHASEWTGGYENWTNNGNPGWNGTGIPNGVGAVAQITTPLADYPGIYQIIRDGVTLGSLNYGNNNDLGAFYLYIQPDSGITFNQDGAGAGFATISNTNTNATDQNALWFNAYSIKIADDLHIVSNTNSANVNGAIQLTTKITGNGNITFNSNGPISSTANSSPGAIWLNQANTFTGNVLVQKGLVVVDNGLAYTSANFTPFGNLSNVLTIGQSGSGDAALLSRLSNASLNSYSIVVAPGLPGETRTFGAASNGTYIVSSGNIALNGNLNLRAGTTSTTAIQTHSGIISGVGNLTKVGPAIASLTGASTYTGKTTVAEGTLRALSLNKVGGGSASSSLGAPTTVANGTIALGNLTTSGALSYVGGGETTDRVIDLAGTTGGGTIDSSGTGALVFTSNFTATGNGAKILTLQGSNTNDNTIQGAIVNSSSNTALTKSGAGKWILSGTNTYSGNTTINGGILQFNSNAAVGGSGDTLFVNLGSTAATGFAIDQTFLDRVGTGAAGVVALAADSSSNLSFTSSDVAAVSLGAVGSRTYSGTITPNGTTYRLGGGGGTLNVSSPLTGAGNSLIVDLNGTPNSTVMLSNASNTYGGGTTVNVGATLRFATSGAVPASGSIIVNSGGIVATDYTLDQAFLNHINNTSTGIVTTNSSANFDFSAGGANLPGVSLGTLGTFTYTGTVTPSGSTYRLGGGGGTLTYSSALTGSGFDLVVNGSGSSSSSVVVLTNTNTYDAGTSINGGTLRLGSSGAIGTTGTISFAGGTLQHTAVNTTDYSSRFSTADNQLFSVDTNGQDITYATGISSGGGSFTKLGAGTLTFSSSNSYTGNTIVDGGTLKLTGSNSGGGAFIIGNTPGSTGNFILDGGSLTTNGPIQLGLVGGATGNFVMNSGNLICNDWIVTGTFGGVGHSAQHGGTIGTVVFAIAQSAGSSGDYTLDSSNSSSQINIVNYMYVGTGGIATMTQNAGDVVLGVPGSEFNVYPELYLGSGTGNGTYNLNAGTLTVNGWSNIGRDTGTGVLNNKGTFITTQELRIGAHYSGAGGTATVSNLNSGTIQAGSILIGIGTSSGTLIQSSTGTIASNDVMFIGDGSGSTGILNQSAGSITTAQFTAFGRNIGSSGTYIHSDGSFVSNADFNIGDYGNGMMDQTGGSVVANGWFVIGYQNSSTGIVNLDGGTIASAGWTVVGNAGEGTLNLDGGTSNVVDNLAVGSASTGKGTINVTSGTINVAGLAPSYTGNLMVGRDGNGTLNVSGGLVDLTSTITNLNSLNSATTSLINRSMDLPENNLDDAQDGNLRIAENGGTGTVNLSGTGLVNVAANIYIGGGNFFHTIAGGNGTLTVSGGAMHVGTFSGAGSTGGDIVLGSPILSSVATINLQGGLLDVSNGTGAIISGGNDSTKTFNFTGGTLKVKEWNATTSLGGTLGDLTQNGAGSLLDVTGNSTTLHSGYALGAGTATVTGQTLTIDAGMTDLTGTGVVNVNTGGALISNNVRAGALNLANGTATIRANGGVAGASKVETLSMTGTSKLDLKDNDLVVGNAVNVTAVRDQIKLGKTINAATGITSDQALFGSKTGFGYAMGNDPNLSPLLTNFSLLTGQSFDADSVLVKYTFLGDADLDGDTDLNDLGKWASNFTGDLNNPAVPAKFWTQGDFDYDGDTDLNDLGKWSSNFTGDLNGGAGSLIVYAPGASASAVSVLNGMGITVVPEPSTFVLAGVGLAGLAIAARRKKRA